MQEVLARARGEAQATINFANAEARSIKEIARAVPNEVTRTKQNTPFNNHLFARTGPDQVLVGQQVHRGPRRNRQRQRHHAQAAAQGNGVCANGCRFGPEHGTVATTTIKSA